MRARLIPALVCQCLMVAAPMRAEEPAPYLMMPEPRSMGSSISRPPGLSQRTVFSPAHRDADGKIVKYDKAEFEKLGISWETFMERAERAADQRLAAMQPELKKNAAGSVAYAVYRTEDDVAACLLIAPALAQVFKKIFGDEVWLAAPDRHSLFVFPARSEAVSEFADDLRERFEDTSFAASDEVFARSPGKSLRAAASFGTK